jgi:hypothetical protein
MINTPAPHAPIGTIPRRRSPLEEMAHQIDGAREDIQRAEAMLPREDRHDREPGERRTQ